jgi:hypothetical protein
VVVPEDVMVKSGGGVTVKFTGLEYPPGGGSMTVMVNVPAVVRRLGSMVEVS